MNNIPDGNLIIAKSCAGNCPNGYNSTSLIYSTESGFTNLNINIPSSTRVYDAKIYGQKYITVGASTTTINSNQTYYAIKLEQFNLDGTPDLNYGDSGALILPPIPNHTYGDYPVQLSITADNKIMLTGIRANVPAAENSSFMYIIAPPIDPTDPIEPIEPTEPIEATCPFVTFSQGNLGHNLRITADHALWATGLNQYGQAGSTAGDAVNPTAQVGTDTDWVSCYANAYNSFAIKSDGTLWGWGQNDNYQISAQTLNDGNTSAIPVQIGTDSNWAQVKCSRYHVLALKTDGTLWAWGHNGMELGLGTTTEVAEPTQVGTDTWLTIEANLYISAGIKTDGTLWTWGNSTENPATLGLGADTFYSNVPAQVGTDHWKSISMNVNSVGVKTDGTLWIWGSLAGIFNSSAGQYAYSPIQIGTSTQWASAIAGHQSLLALKTYGTIWWLHNNISAQVGTDSDWTAIGTGYGFNFAQKNNSDLYGWGPASNLLFGTEADVC